MSAKLILSVITVLLFSAILHAQGDYRDGYIIEKNGKKIPCKVRYQSSMKKYERCFFKYGGVDMSYGPSDLLEYGYDDNKHFVSDIITGEFVEELLVGEFMSLYLGREGFLVKKDDQVHLLQLDPMNRERVQGKWVTTRNLRWRGTLVSLLVDCFLLDDEAIAKLTYREKDIVRQVQNYNDCRGGISSEVKEPINPITIETELTLGLNLSMRRYVPDGSFAFYNWTGGSTSSNALFGMNLLLVPGRFNDRIAFVTGFSVTKMRMEGTFSSDGNDLQINSLDVPFAVRFYSRSEASRFFFQGGVEFKRNNDSLSGIYDRKFRRPSLQLIGGFSHKMKKGNVGFMVGTSEVREDIRRFFISLFVGTEIFR